MKITAVFLPVSLIYSACLVEGFSGNGFGISSGTFSPSILQHHINAGITRSQVRLFSTNSPLEQPNDIDEKLSEKDPLKYIYQELQNLDVNAIINSAIIIFVAVAALSKFSTVDYSIMRGWSATEMAVRIPVDNWNGYNSVLAKSPIFTKAITSATVYTIGDLIAQRTAGTSMGDIDRPRVVRSLLAGLIGHGPLSHVWYNVSEDVFENILHLTEWWSVFPKVVIDQSTWGPFWNNTYILLLGLMKFDKPEIIWGEMKRTTIPLIVSGLKLWPLAHCITYGLVPIENRLLWVDLVEILWVVILATATSGGENIAEDTLLATATSGEENIAEETLLATITSGGENTADDTHSAS